MKGGNSSQIGAIASAGKWSVVTDTADWESGPSISSSASADVDQAIESSDASFKFSPSESTRYRVVMGRPGTRSLARPKGHDKVFIWGRADGASGGYHAKDGDISRGGGISMVRLRSFGVHESNW